MYKIAVSVICYDNEEEVLDFAGDHNDTQINMFEYPDEKKILKKLYF